MRTYVYPFVSVVPTLTIASVLITRRVITDNRNEINLPIARRATYCNTNLEILKLCVGTYTVRIAYQMVATYVRGPEGGKMPALAFIAFQMWLLLMAIFCRNGNRLVLYLLGLFLGMCLTIDIYFLYMLWMLQFCFE